MNCLPDDATKAGSSRHKAPIEGLPTPTLKPMPRRAMADGVKYIPSQMDPLVGATAKATRQDPISLMIQDASVLLRLWRLVPNIILPFFTSDTHAEFHLCPANVMVGCLQILLTIIQLLYLVLVVPAFVSLPGGVFLAATALCCLVCYFATLPMQGRTMNYSKVDDSIKALVEQHKNERWVFVNGICTGYKGSTLPASLF